MICLLFQFLERVEKYSEHGEALRVARLVLIGDLGQLLIFLEPQFPHTQMEGNDTFITLRSLNEIACISD